MPLAQSGGNNVGSSQIIDDQIIDADINSAANIDKTKIDLLNKVGNDEIEDDIISKVKVTMSAADIIALNTTPKTLITAPGAGKVLVIDSIVGVFKPGGTQFTGTGTDMMIREETSVTTLVDNAFSTANVTGASQVIKWMRLQLVAGPIVLTTNKGIYVTLLSNSFATGNGTIDFHITYRVITI